MRTVFSTLLVVSLASPAAAQYFSDPRAVGMAGAVRGDPTANSALVTNPAGMARGYHYSAEAEYYRLRPGVEPDINIVGASIVDSKTQPKVAVGVAYAYQFTDSGETPHDGHDGRIGFAVPMVPNEFNIGVGLRYIHVERGEEDEGPKGFTLDAGIVYSPTPTFNIGLVGNNLINRDDPTLPRQAGGGVSYTGELVTLVVDVVADFDTAEDTKPVFAVGFESVLAELVPVRFGYERNQATEQDYLAGGLGFVGGADGQGSQLALSYRQNLNQSDDFVFAAGFSLFL